MKRLVLVALVLCTSAFSQVSTVASGIKTVSTLPATCPGGSWLRIKTGASNPGLYDCPAAGSAPRLIAIGGNFTARGAYAAGTTYAALDLVSYNGAAYVSLAASNTGHTPDSSPTWWAQPGPQGPTGATGATGAAGADGVSVVVTVEALGVNCAAGGFKLVSVSGTSYVCNGVAGTNGANGTGYTYRGAYGSKPSSPVTGDTMLFYDGTVAGICASSNFGGAGTNYVQCTWNGSAFVSIGGATYPGVAADGANGLTVAGAFTIGTGSATAIDVVCVNIASLPAVGSVPTGRHMQVCDGVNGVDSTVGGGSNKHWVYSTGAAWVSEDSTGPTGATGATGATGSTGPAGAAVVAPVSISSNCNTTRNWAVGSVGIAAGTLTLTGSCTLTVSGMLSGGFYTVLVSQDATGSRTLTLGTGGTGGCASWKVGQGGSGAVTPTTTANAKDVLAIFYDGTDCYANYRGNFN